MNPAQLERAIRLQLIADASWSAYRVASLLATMRAYRMPLPACWRGVRR